jgi:hypothetical protein
MDLSKLIFQLPNNPWQFTTEARFTTWLGRKIKDAWWFFYKISDDSRGTKPWDAEFAFDWIAWVMEIKVTKKKNYKPYNLLRWSSISNPGGQCESLRQYSKNGWLWLVVVYNQGEITYQIYKFTDLDLYRDTVVWDKGISYKTSGVVSL